MKKLAITFLLIQFYFLSYSQSDLREGYIIQLNHDTLTGLIDFRGDVKNSISCLFVSKSKILKRYNPAELAGYRFLNGKYYVSKFVKRSDTTSLLFVEYLVKGQKNLYYFRDDVGFHYLIDKNSDTLTEIPYHEQDINRDGTNYYYVSKSYIGYLETYFSKCPELKTKIEKINKPGFENLINLTKEYHHLTCGDSGCIVYYKPEPLLGIAFEPQLGMMHYNGEKHYIKQFNGMFYLWLPRSNENIYFKTGLSYSMQPGNDGYNLYRIPLQFEYLFSGKDFRPKFALGTDMFFLHQNGYETGVDLTFVASGGIMLKMYNFLYLDLLMESDLFAFRYDTKFLLSNSFTAGLYFKF